MKRTIVIWAAIDNDGEIVGAYTNRLSVLKRIEYLNTWGKELTGKVKGRLVGPFQEVKCIGEVEIK